MGYNQLLHLLHLDDIKHKQRQNKERNVKAEDEGERGKEVTKEKDRKEECDKKKKKWRQKEEGKEKRGGEV